MATVKMTVLQQTLLYGVGIAIMKGISLLMLPWLAFQLAPAEMGRLEVLTSVAILGSIVLAMGLEDALYRFVGAEKNSENKRVIAGQVVGLALMLTLLALLLAPFLALSVNWLFWRLWAVELQFVDLLIIFGFLSLEALVAVCLGWIRIREKAVVFFMATVGRAVFQAALVGVCVFFGLGVTGILLAGLIALLVQAVWLGWMQYRETGIEFRFGLIRPVLIYCLPIVGSGLVSFPLAGLDRWLLLGVVELDTIAQYGIASKFALATVLLLQPFGMWWSPKRFEYLHGNNGRQQVVKYICVGLCLTLLVALVVSMVSPWLIELLFPPHYLDAAQYALGLILVMALKEAVELVNIGCFVGKTTRTQFVINLVGTLVGLLSMAVLLWGDYGVWAVIGGLVLAQLCRLYLFFSFSQRYLPLDYPLGRLFCLVMAALLLLVIAQVTPSQGMHLVIALAGGGGLLFLALSLDLLPTEVWRKREEH